MKLAIVGSPKTFESKSIQKYAKDFFDQCDCFSLYDLKFVVGEKPAVFWQDKEIIEYYDAFLLRGVSKNISLAYFLVQFAYNQGKCIIDEKYVTRSNLGSKLSTMGKVRQAGVPAPKTSVCLDAKKIKKEILSELGYPLIMKLAVGGRKGKEVYRVESEEQLNQLVKEKKENLGDFLFQEYILSDFDVRVLVVGGRAVGAMKRTSPRGDFRANIALGGKGTKFELTKKLANIAEKAAEAVDDEIAGVDVMFSKNKPSVIEVNRAPQFQEFVKVTGIEVGKIIAEYAYNKTKKHLKK